MDSEDTHDWQGLFGAQCSNPAMSIIGAEDEDFENDLDPTVDDHCSHFNSIELVKVKPTHLLVFLQHVILQFDCAPVLCYLHADLFKNLSAKETKKHFVEFYNNFLDKGAILRVSMPTVISYELDRTRPELIPEDQQKRMAQEIQTMQAPEVLRQLEDFRQKRMMGMTPNELELIEVENHHPTERIPMDMKEKAMAETLLDKMSEIHPTIVADEEKFSSIFGAVAFYMKHLGVKTRATDSKKSRGFFRKKILKKAEDPKPRQRGGFPSILSEAGRWMSGSNVEIKASKLDNEGDKGNQERKGSSGATPSRPPDGPVAPFQNRKSGSIGSGSLPGSEGSEPSGINISVTSSPDSSQSEIGLTSSRSDPLSASEGGEVSPAGLGVGLSIWEAPSVNETPLEESQDKDRNVRRSESLCVERRHSRRGGSARAKQSRSRSDVDLQAAAATTVHPPSPSPLVNEGVIPVEGSPISPTSGPSPQQEEMEPRLLELEQDPPNWREQAPSDELSSMSKKEIKRQEVINELFVTEHAHVRMLSVLQTVFFRPLEKEEIMPLSDLYAIFPSLDEIIDMHYVFYENLKKLRQEDNFIVKAIGTTLLNRFNGSEGEWFQKLTARFCSHQSWSLELIKSRQKKDARFNLFILEAESKPQCRRLQLKDIIPTEMQRLTKYPLLLENIAKSTEDSTERGRIEQSAECCRKILNHVNEEVKQMENLLTLKDYQRRLDTSGLKPSNELYTEYKGIDLTSRKMLYEGPVTWRVTKEKALDVQCVLLGDLLVLLQRQDDKMVLKCQSKSSLVVQDGKQMLSPIIRLDSAFLREVATDRKAFYVIFTWASGAQIYELVAHSVAERKNWTELIKTAVDDLKKSGGSGIERARFASLPAGAAGPPYSPISLPSFSPTENGGDSLKNSSDRDKDSLLDEKSGDSIPSLMDYLSTNGFDLIGHSNAPPAKVANGALDEIMSLKRLLVGSISLSEDSQLDEENGGVGPDNQDQEAEGCQSPEEDSGVDGQKEKEEEEGGEDGGMKGEEERGISAPLVLSQERLEEVQRRMQSLEDKLKKLQSVEEEHHRLQEVLAKFSLVGGNYQ